MDCFGRKGEMFRKYVEKHILRACVYEKKIVILQRKTKGTAETQVQPNTRTTGTPKHKDNRRPETQVQPNEGPEVQRAQTQKGQTGRGGKTRSFFKHEIL